MSAINRRQWLQLSGLGGLALTLSPMEILADPHQAEVLTLNAPNFAKLNSNENPFGPSQVVRKAMIEGFDLGCRYPYGKMNDLAQMLADEEGVSREHIVMCAGSTEGLKATGLTYGVNGGEIIAADPVYKALLVYAEQFGAFINKVPLTKAMGHDLDEMDRRVTRNTSLVFLCNPNNPSGSLIPKQELVDFCNSVSDKTVVFSDEAYYDFITEPGYPSMIELVKEGKNIIVSRTFSKVYGLAGLRVGYLIARPDIAGRVRRNVMAKANMMAVVGAMAAMNDPEFYAFSLKKNDESKAIICSTLDEMGLEYVQSHTNFVFFKTGQDIRDLIPKMRSKGVEIGRPFPPLLDWCRISTGTIPHTEKFVQALKNVI